MVQFWEVVGGADKGGILVRRGQDITSEKCAERLSCGSLLEEVKVVGDRLGYKRVTGSGPTEGWVSISLPGKSLVVKTSKRPPPREEKRVAPQPREERRPAPQPREEKRFAPQPREEQRAPPLRAAQREPPRMAPADPQLNRSDLASLVPSVKPHVEQVPVISDDPIRIGDFGDSPQRSPFRIRAVPPMQGVPAGGFIGSIAWDVPMGQLPDALSEVLGISRGVVAVGWRGRDLEDDMTLESSGAIGSSRGAKQRALDQIVELVFTLERGVVVKLKTPKPPTPAAEPTPEAVISSSPEPANKVAAAPAIPSVGGASEPARPSATELRFAAQLDQLASMGFTDKGMLLPILEAKRGNVQGVIDVLLS